MEFDMQKEKTKQKKDIPELRKELTCNCGSQPQYHTNYNGMSNMS